MRVALLAAAISAGALGGAAASARAQQLGSERSWGDSRRCADCHAEIAREWRASEHAGSWSDPRFRSAFAREPLPFCRSCHAPPRVAPGAGGRTEAPTDGITCVVCHVRGGHVVVAGSEAPDAPHPTRAAPGLTRSTFCAGCHQFDFPPSTGITPPRPIEPMQATFDEWRRSAAGLAGEGCASCHMPWVVGRDGTGHRSHRFPGIALLPGILEPRVEATLLPSGDVRVSFTLSTARVGHALPTGDVFRRVEVRAWLASARRVSARTILERRFGHVPAMAAGGMPMTVLRALADTRLQPTPNGRASLELVLRSASVAAGSRPTRVRWAIDHLRMSPAMADTHGIGERDNRTPVARGTVVARAAPDPSRAESTAPAPGIVGATRARP